MQPLRPFQIQAIQTLRHAGHLICVSPTGSGKSRIYEHAAAQPGVRTLLVTPLVALARQQRDSFTRAGVPVRLGAGPEPDCPAGRETGAWIISPEALEYASRQRVLERWRPNFLVVDECHCLWEWGQDFRPSFQRLPELLRDHEIPRSLWLTATLPRGARAELRSKLPSPVREQGGFALPSRLRLRVARAPWVDRAELLVRWILSRAEAGMVYSPTREWSERIARMLAAVGKRTLAYHAGMSSEERVNLEARISAGSVDVVVATSAFGMGMHHEHLRWAVLWQAPTSLLSLAQIAGRVGRNPESDSTALVLWDEEDFRLLSWTIQDSERRREELEGVRRFLVSNECRETFLRKHFDGSEAPGRCGRCDRCS